MKFFMRVIKKKNCRVLVSIAQIVSLTIVLKPVNEFLSGLSVLTDLGEIWFRSSRNAVN
jgi:hypothetical protein